MTWLRYITQDGRLIEEKTRINERYIEQRDGFHPMTNDCVFQDSQRRRDNSILIAEQCTVPLGSKMGHFELSNFYREYVVAESKFKQPTVSKRWMRTLAAIGTWLMTYGVGALMAIFVIGVVAYSLLGSA